MRNLTSILAIIASILMLTACRTKATSEPDTTLGSDYQVVVICEDELWNGELSTAVRNLLEDDVPGLVRPESYFDIVKQVSPDNIEERDRRYGLTFKLEISPAYNEATYKVANDIYAQPQTIVTLSAANVEEAIAFMEANADELREVMNESERIEAIKAAKSVPAEQLMDDFEGSTGYRMLIPHGFFKAKTANEELTWYLRDYPNKAQYIFTFTTDYNPELSIEDESAEIIDAIDNKFNTIKSKDVSNSYMQISPYREVFVDVKEINGIPMLELRGCWEVENDYMGGSFIAYTIFDEETSRATVVIFALYAPEDYQRNLMRELESLIYTLD